MRRTRPAATLPVLMGLLLLGLTAPAAAIFGGTPADPGEYPAVGLVMVTDSGGLVSTTCGGTLVAPTKVLTVPQCVQPGETYVALDFTDTDEIFPFETAEMHLVVASQVHPLWDGGLEYAVAVLTLDSPSAVAPVRVVGPGEESLWTEGTPGTILGWGLTSDSGTPSDQLMEAQVPVRGDCASDTVFCAGDGDPRACAGDSGGPLLVDDAGEPVLAGVIAGGADGCAASPQPDVYAKIGSDPLHSWLAPQLVPDTRGPRVTGQVPTGKRVPRGRSVRVEFSEQVTPATVTRSTFQLFRMTPDGPRKVAGTVVVTAGARAAVLDPFGATTKRLARGTTYRVVVSTQVRDVAGNRLDQAPARDGLQPKRWTFRTTR